MTLRLTEKEAIALGIIKPPTPPAPASATSSPQARSQYRQRPPFPSGAFLAVIVFIAGWMFGFVMGLSVR